MQKILIILSIIFSTDLFACRVWHQDSTVSEGTQTAKIIMLVEKIPNKDPKKDDVKFRAGPPWEMTLTTWDSECLWLTPKERGFFIFLTAMDKKRLQKETVRMGAGVMIDIDDVKSIDQELEWITKRQEIPDGHPNTFWSFCREDKECVQVKNSCDDFVGVNEKYKESYSNYIKAKKYPKKCRAKVKRLKSTCVNYLCS